MNVAVVSAVKQIHQKCESDTKILGVYIASEAESTFACAVAKVRAVAGGAGEECETWTMRFKGNDFDGFLMFAEEAWPRVPCKEIEEATANMYKVS